MVHLTVCQYKNKKFLSFSATAEHSSDILKDRRNMKTQTICTDEFGRNVDVIIWCCQIQKDNCIENEKSFIVVIVYAYRRLLDPKHVILVFPAMPAGSCIKHQTSPSPFLHAEVFLSPENVWDCVLAGAASTRSASLCCCGGYRYVSIRGGFDPHHTGIFFNMLI